MKSLKHLGNYFSVLKHFSFFENTEDNLSLDALLSKYPTMLIGCKKDLVDQNKTTYMGIDTKVKNTLKSLGDIEHLIQYT